MSDVFSHIYLGFSVALSLHNILLCFVGCLLGTLIGVLPGIGPIATIAILLPITFGFEPASALIMVAGIYYGAQYGSSTTAILLAIPGETSSAVTVLDGHEMAKKGRAGIALGISAIGSFFAGTVSTVVVAALAIPLTAVALSFGPPEYFALMVTGFVFAAALARGPMLERLAVHRRRGAHSRRGAGPRQRAVAHDLRHRCDRGRLRSRHIGHGLVRHRRDSAQSRSDDVARRDDGHDRAIVAGSQGVAPNDLADDLRGTLIGGALGILPGNGAVLGSFASYTVEKKLARDPSRFGRGAIEGVAGPESANNAGAQTSFIPLLTIGIPPNAVMAIMVGAMTIHGIIPGPQVINTNPDLFWGLIASMWVGNLMLLIINLPLINIWVRLLKVPYRLLFPAIILFCCVGVFSINGSAVDIVIMAVFGLVGYLMSKVGFEPAPLLLGVVLGRMMEEAFRQSMIMSSGQWNIFVTRPISGGLLLFAAVTLVIVLLPTIRKRREEIFVEEEE